MLYRILRDKCQFLYKDSATFVFDTKNGCIKLFLKGDDIGIGIRKAAEYWRKSDVDIVKKLENLERDCINAPYHCFGIHDNCSQYFCQKTTSPESKTTFDKLKASGLFHEILNYCNIYFASNVRSLIADLTNNSAEEFNNVVAKYLGKQSKYTLFYCNNSFSYVNHRR